MNLLVFDIWNDFYQSCRSPPCLINWKKEKRRCELCLFYWSAQKMTNYWKVKLSAGWPQVVPVQWNSSGNNSWRWNMREGPLNTYYWSCWWQDTSRIQLWCCNKLVHPKKDRCAEAYSYSQIGDDNHWSYCNIANSIAEYWFSIFFLTWVMK